MFEQAVYECAAGHAGSRMHDHASRLVHHDHMVVFMHHGERHRFRPQLANAPLHQRVQRQSLAAGDALRRPRRSVIELERSTPNPCLELRPGELAEALRRHPVQPLAGTSCRHRVGANMSLRGHRRDGSTGRAGHPTAVELGGKER